MTEGTTTENATEPPPVRIEDRDREDFGRAVGEWQEAQRAVNAASAALQRAAEAEIACRGAKDFLSARLGERYQLLPEDKIGADGTILRAATT